MSHKKCSRRLLTLTILIAMSTGIFSIPPASAGNFGPLYGDGSYHGFVYSSILQQRWRAAVDWTRINSYDTTDINTAVECCNNAHVDVYVGNGSPSGDEDASWTCLTLNELNGQECDHGVIEFDAYSDFGATGNRALACHEVGHSLGLRHGTSGSLHYCMMSPTSSPYLGGHNVDHLNVHYQPGV